MVRNRKWFVVLGITVLAFGLLFGSALADSGDAAVSEEGSSGWNMHEQMDPALYGQMIQRMTEVHGAEFTGEMVQRMNEEGGCHGDGQGMMGAGMMNGFHGMMGEGFEGTVGSMMRGVQGFMNGDYGNGGMMNGGMMGR